MSTGTHQRPAARRHLTRQRACTRALPGVLVAVLLALLAAICGPRADAGERGAGHPVRPTIVLVHGAWADSSSWSAVVRRLQHDHYTVVVPPNPLRSLSGDSAYLGAFLHTVPGPIVLVGHSYGGAVVTNAAAGNTNVKALVFVDAFVPDQGESVLQLAAARPGSALAVTDPTTVFSLVPYPGAAPGDFDLYVLPQVFRNAFANDLPGRRAATLAATQRPVALSALGEPSGAPAWKATPSWYLVGTEDRVLPPAEQLAMASRPGAVARLVEQAARSTH